MTSQLKIPRKIHPEPCNADKRVSDTFDLAAAVQLEQNPRLGGCLGWYYFCGLESRFGQVMLVAIVEQLLAELIEQAC